GRRRRGPRGSGGRGTTTLLGSSGEKGAARAQGPRRRGGGGSWRSGGAAGADHRQVDLEGDLLADEHPTGLQGGVPVHAPVLAVDGGAALEAHPLVAERVDGVAGVGEV